MLRSFKEFWSDYFEVCKHSWQWLGKHWKGYIVLCVITSVICMVPYYIEYRKNQKRISEWRRQFKEREQ